MASKLFQVIHIAMKTSHCTLHAAQQDKQNKEPIIDDNREGCSLPSVKKVKGSGSRF
jgi:hypothetical protein